MFVQKLYSLAEMVPKTSGRLDTANSKPDNMHKKGEKTMGAKQAEKLAAMIEKARCMAFFGGAGVSRESGIPDFRSTDGIYRQTWAYPPETILSRDFFRKNPGEFYRFYKERMIFPDALPNAAHRALARLEKTGILSGVITQNIDGLHQAAGSCRVMELHGSVHRNFCMKCKKSFTLDEIMLQEGVPVCPCGGIIKPDVVLYGEILPSHTVKEALGTIGDCDLLVIGGTSLTVYPAAGFVYDYPGKIAIINCSKTPMDERADLCISAPIGETMAAVMALLEG